jgi:hypothetical protein
MKPHTKTAATSAAKWAFWLSAGMFVGPIVGRLARATWLPGEILFKNLVVAIFWFPILFFGIWAWKTFSKKATPMIGAVVQPAEPTTEAAVAMGQIASLANTTPKKPGKWNYVGIGVGIFMLLLLFLPPLINGTLANQYYLGAAFWVGVIIYCSLNIFRYRRLG